MSCDAPPPTAATRAGYPEAPPPFPAPQRFPEPDAAAASSADNPGLLQPAPDPTIVPSPGLLAKTAYYRVLNAAETKQWNDIFNAVIIA